MTGILHADWLGLHTDCSDSARIAWTPHGLLRLARTPQRLARTPHSLHGLARNTWGSVNYCQILKVTWDKYFFWWRGFVVIGLGRASSTRLFLYRCALIMVLGLTKEDSQPEVVFLQWMTEQCWHWRFVLGFCACLCCCPQWQSPEQTLNIDLPRDCL